MGMDSVELVMAWEEEFGISIADEEAESIRTIGNATDLIYQKVQTSLTNSAATEVIRALGEIAEKPEEIRGDDALDDLIPLKSRRSRWNRLQKKLGYAVVPGLRRPHWLVWTGYLIMLLVAVSAWPKMGWGLLLALLAGLVFVAFTRRFERSFPSDCRTVSDLISRLDKQHEIFRSHQRAKREKVRDKVIAITVDQLGIKPEKCVEDARFIEDLGCD